MRTNYINANNIIRTHNYSFRIWTDDSKSQCQLSRKFGASEESIRPLLKLARLLSLNVIGVSFHVGSGSQDPGAFVSSVDMARRAFDIGHDMGYEFTILDVGGGFCHDDFESVARVLGEKIDEQFPEEMGVRIIAEPGRYFVASAFTLATNVIARRVGFATESNPDKSYMCMFPSTPVLIVDYLSDGVYGSFNCILYDHQNPVPKLLSHEGRFYYDSPDRYSTPLQRNINVRFGVQHAMASTASLRPSNFPLSSKSAIGFTLKIWEHTLSVPRHVSTVSALVKSFTSVASHALRNYWIKIRGWVWGGKIWDEELFRFRCFIEKLEILLKVVFSWYNLDRKCSLGPNGSFTLGFTGVCDRRSLVCCSLSL